MSPYQNAEESNATINEYLLYFLGTDYAPGFAFMLTGAWGSGKTHFIKHFLEVHRPDSSDPKIEISEQRRNSQLRKDPGIYISLNGMEKVEEIDWAIVQQCLPFETGRKVQAGTRLGADVLRALCPRLDKIKASDVAQFLPKLRGRFIVFDDFERCDVSEPILLGYINSLVEHAQNWVVIIANSEKTTDSFREIKEKVIGHTMTLRPEFSKPFTNFCERRLETSCKKAIEPYSPLIQSVFQSSETGNLRVLEQSIMLLAQVLPAIDSWWEEREFMTTFLTIFLGLCFDVKVGRLSKSDLKFSRLVAGLRGEKEAISNLEKSAKRYGFNYLVDQMLSDDLWVEILVDGVVDQSEVRSQVERSRFLEKIEDQPAWRVAWHYLVLDSQHIENAIKKMEQQFHDRHWRTSIELLQVAGIAIRFSNDNICSLSIEKLRKLFLAYIDDIYSKKIPEFDSALVKYDSDIVLSNGTGLGIMEADSDLFDEIRQYLKEKQVEAMEKTLIELAQKLPDMLTNEFDEFRETLLETEQNFQKKEFLHLSDEKHVAKAISQIPGRKFQDLHHVLSSRSRYSRLHKYTNEIDFLKRLALELEKVAVSVEPIQRVRLRWLAVMLKSDS